VLERVCSKECVVLRGLPVGVIERERGGGQVYVVETLWCSKEYVVKEYAAKSAHGGHAVGGDRNFFPERGAA